MVTWNLWKTNLLARINVILIMSVVTPLLRIEQILLISFIGSCSTFFVSSTSYLPVNSNDIKITLLKRLKCIAGFTNVSRKISKASRDEYISNIWRFCSLLKMLILKTITKRITENSNASNLFFKSVMLRITSVKITCLFRALPE